MWDWFRQPLWSDDSLWQGILLAPSVLLDVGTNCLAKATNALFSQKSDNIKFFKENIPGLLEVSIGHALISESLYLGLENVVNMYLQKLK